MTEKPARLNILVVTFIFQRLCLLVTSADRCVLKVAVAGTLVGCALE